MAQNVELFLLTRATAFILMFLRPKNDRECLMLVPTQNIYSTLHSRRPPLPPQGPVAFSRRPRPVQHPAPVTSEFLKMLKFSSCVSDIAILPLLVSSAPPPEQDNVRPFFTAFTNALLQISKLTAVELGELRFYI